MAVTQFGPVRQLLELYEEFPFQRHPLWLAVLTGELNVDQVIRAECQHYLRTRAGQMLRRKALENARSSDLSVYELLLETYLEECTEREGQPSHLSLIERLVVLGGVPKESLDCMLATPGNAAAIALYKHISDRGAALHMIGAGVVEHYYSFLCPRIYEAYTRHYAMTPDQAETYRIHGSMDKIHAERAFMIVEQAIASSGWESVRTSVRDAFVATSLHYDGMLQAATGANTYWDGVS